MTPPLPFAAIIAAAFGKIRYASRGNPTVVVHLLRTLSHIAPALTTVEQRDALVAQADAATRIACATLMLESDRTEVLRAYRAACETLGRQPVQAIAEAHRTGLGERR